MEDGLIHQLESSIKRITSLSGVPAKARLPHSRRTRLKNTAGGIFHHVLIAMRNSKASRLEDRSATMHLQRHIENLTGVESFVNF